MKLRVDRDSTAGGEPVLLIDYPARSSDPAGRDVYFEAAHRDGQREARSAPHQFIACNLGVRLVSRPESRCVHRVDGIEARRGTRSGSGSAMFGENPYFQPPDANRGAPLDVSDVGGIGLAPQDSASGTWRWAGLSW